MAANVITTNDLAANAAGSFPYEARASRMFYNALILGTAEGWQATALVWSSRLTLAQRAGAAYAALLSLPEGTAAQVAVAAHGGAGAPLPAFGDVLDEALDWAFAASDDERQAYAYAAARALPAPLRRALIDQLETLTHDED